MRTIFGAVTVVLLAAIAYLLYANYVNGNAPLGTTLDQPGDTLPLPAPAPTPAPIQAQPAQPILTPQPTVQPPPALPVQHSDAQPAPVPAAPVGGETPGKRTHVVQSGESLWTISKEYYGNGNEHARIAVANHLCGNRIRAGQVLIIPPAPEDTRHTMAATEPDNPTEAEGDSNSNNHSNEEASAPALDDHEQSSAAIDPMPPTLNVAVPASK